MYDDGWNDQGLPPGPMRQTPDPVGEVLRYMGQTGLDAQKGATILRTAVEKYRSSVSYPKTPIGQSLRGVAQVKLADLGTRVFYTAHNGLIPATGGACAAMARCLRSCRSILRRPSNPRGGR